MENFTNNIVLPRDLPEVDKKSFTALDRKYLRILIIRIFFFLIVMGCGLAAVLLLAEGIPVLTVGLAAGGVILLVTVLSLVLTILGFSRKGFLVREQDISFQRGIITYKLTTVPFNRIQHVEVNQGILAKILHLASVKIYTAGGSMSDLTIPGLPVGDAKRLKAFLSGKISEHE